MAAYTLTIRKGPKVSREKHETIEEAIDSMRDWAQRVRAEGDLPEITMFRKYESGKRVHARLEISTGGWLRGRDAGVDVMGDGALVPFRGGAFRKRLEPEEDEDVFEVVTKAMLE